MRRWHRSLVFIALALFLVMSAAVGSAAVETTVGLTESDQNTSSTALTTDPSNCPNQWKPSDSAVVWKLEVVSQGQDESEISIGDFSYQMSDQSSVNDELVQSGTAFIRTSDHNTLIDASVAITDNGEQTDDQYILRLAGVCYEGAGPIPGVTFVFQADVCDSIVVIEGNQIDANSAAWDETSGAWEAWATIYQADAPLVTRMAEPTSGCAWRNGEKFAIGTSSSMANRWPVPGATGSGGHGTVEVASADFPDALKWAMVADGGQLWFERVGSGEVTLAAFKCHDDSLHADSYEFIPRMPGDGAEVVCVSHNVWR